MSNGFFTINKGISLSPQTSDPSGAQNGDMYYNGTTGKFRKYENSGWADVTSNDSLIKNNISTANSKFETDTGSWVTYDDGASLTPVDGTGGSPSAITITTTTTAGEVLEGTRSLKIVKSAADGQGEGTSVLTATIDRADRGKPFFVYMSYDATHANYAYGDLQIFAYDVTNSQLLTVYNNDSNGKLLQQKARFSGVVYTQDTTQQIRLIIHCTSTNASAYDVFVDEVSLTSQANVTGPVMTNWEPYTPTLTGFGSATSVDFKYRRVGDTLQVRGRFTAGTTTAVEARIGLPNNLITSSQTSALMIAGTFARNNLGGASGAKGGIVLSEAGVSYVTLCTANLWSGTSENWDAKANANTHWASTDEGTFDFAVKIDGWSAGATLSANDAGLQTVRIMVNSNAATSFTSAVTDIPYTVTTYDNYNAWNGTQFTAPRSGHYSVIGSIYPNAGVTAAARIYINGTLAKIGGAVSSGRPISVSSIVSLNKGDTLSIRAGVSGTLENLPTAHFLEITSVQDFNTFGVQGPIIVGASTDWVSGGATVISATTTAPTKGTVQTDEVWWRRVGDSMEVRMSYRQTTAGSGGTGDYLFQIPGSYKVDTSKLKVNTTVQGSSFGTIIDSNLGHYIGSNGATGTINWGGGVSAYSDTYVRLNGSSHASASNSGEVISATGRGIGNANVSYNIFFTVPIVGWSSETRLYPTQRVTGTTYLKDIKAANTAGGTFTSGAYQTRTLNTQEGDTGFCSLSSNQFILQPGTYEIYAKAPAAVVSTHKAKLRNITDSTDAIIGSSETTTTGNTNTTSSFVYGRITITSSKTYELQHRCTTTRATDGFGVQNNFGDSEVYAVVKIDKIY